MSLTEHTNGLAMFTATVARIPDSPAMHYFDRTFSFRELDQMSDALAVALQSRGCREGDRIAAYLQNVPQFPITVLAAWKIGAILVSVNPMLKGKEVATILRDSGARVLVTHHDLWDEVVRDVVADTVVDIPLVTSPLDFLVGPPPAQLARYRHDGARGTLDFVEEINRNLGSLPDQVELGAENIALLTYTSGTTGPAKGAINTHSNVVYNATAYRAWGALTEEDVLLAVAPLFHITGLVAHIATSFLTGMPQVLFHRFDPELALELVERYRATFTVGAITVFISLMDAAPVRSRDLSSLQKVMSGGAPISPATADAYEELTGVYIHNVYGLTETSGPSHFVPRGVRAPVDPGSGSLAVGLPVPGTHTRIVDDDQRELISGEVGEILIRGPQVVAGYWDRKEESAHAIVDGELRTGDLGFMDDEGWLYVVDRKKDQINAAGFKVWPREVEETLLGHNSVKEAAVVGRPDAYRGETVKAFVVLTSGRHVPAEELIQYCRERMAAYKYPREIEFLDELPKTASGKVLRRTLRVAES